MGRIRQAVSQAVARTPEFISTLFAANLALIPHLPAMIGFTQNLMITRHSPPIACYCCTGNMSPRTLIAYSRFRPHPVSERVYLFPTESA